LKLNPPTITCGGFELKTGGCFEVKMGGRFEMKIGGRFDVKNSGWFDDNTQFFPLCRRHTLWKLFRSEMWRDAERAIGEVSAGRAETMADAIAHVRHRTTHSGRSMPKRTISTPLLLKGLEFDHVFIPDATHFSSESKAQAKLFYVAISRATRTLTIGSSSRYLQFPPPNI